MSETDMQDVALAVADLAKTTAAIAGRCWEALGADAAMSIGQHCMRIAQHMEQLCDQAPEP